MAPEYAGRVAARVLLIDPRDRLLLLDAALNDGRRIWLPPGGGIEPGEALEDAAIREVLEETGIISIPRGSASGRAARCSTASIRPRPSS